MALSASIPITITPEAANRIEALGIHREIERMMEQAGRFLPDLERIEVNLYDRFEFGDEPGLSIDLYNRSPYDRRNHDERNLIRWLVREFPSEILQWIIMDHHPGNANAG